MVGNAAGLHFFFDTGAVDFDGAAMTLLDGEGAARVGEKLASFIAQADQGKLGTHMDAAISNGAPVKTGLTLKGGDVVSATLTPALGSNDRVLVQFHQSAIRFET